MLGLLGIWLLLSTILFHFHEAGIINFIVVGIISAVAGFTLSAKKTFEGWVGAVLGIWLIFSAFIPSIGTIPSNYYNAFITGLLFILIGFVTLENKSGLMKN